MSKCRLEVWECGLTGQTAHLIWDTFFIPSVDLFASKNFHLVDSYCSWFPDEKALARDAFSLVQWPNESYAFPPVPLIRAVLDKIRTDRMTAIIVVPQWKTSLWWDTLMEMLVEEPLYLGWHENILESRMGHTAPHLGHLMACVVRG